MKKFAYVIAAIAAAFAVSCTKETPLETPNTDAPAEVGMKEVTITASIDPETKTSYDADGKFSWTKGDQISVLCSDEAVYTFTATSSGASTTFTGLLPGDVTLGGQAFFPANENHAKNSFYLAANSDALDASLPMVGTKTEGNSYEFAHCSGGFQFTIRNIPSEYTILGAEFVTSSLKISGTYEVWHDDNGKYIYGVYGAADDSEKKYSCKVTVSDGEAKVYLPYGIGGDLWGTTTVKFVGYNETESKDLFSKDIKLGGKVHARATVIPVAAIELPTYVQPVDWTNVDWTSEAVVSWTQEDWMYTSYPNYCDVKELKAVADMNYIYVKATPTKVSNEIRYYFADGGENKSGDLWMWEKTLYGTFYKSSRATVTNNEFALKYNDSDVDLMVETDGEVVVWNMAFPRSAGSWTSAPGFVYFGLTTYGTDGDTKFEALAPKVWGEMLAITLP